MAYEAQSRGRARRRASQRCPACCLFLYLVSHNLGSALTPPRLRLFPIWTSLLFCLLSQLRGALPPNPSLCLYPDQTTPQCVCPAQPRPCIHTNHFRPANNSFTTVSAGGGRASPANCSSWQSCSPQMSIHAVEKRTVF